MGTCVWSPIIVITMAQELLFSLLDIYNIAYKLVSLRVASKVFSMSLKTLYVFFYVPFPSGPNVTTIIWFTLCILYDINVLYYLMFLVTSCIMTCGSLYAIPYGHFRWRNILRFSIAGEGNPWPSVQYLLSKVKWGLYKTGNCQLGTKDSRNGCDSVTPRKVKEHTLPDT